MINNITLGGFLLLKQTTDNSKCPDFDGVCLRTPNEWGIRIRNDNKIHAFIVKWPFANSHRGFKHTHTHKHSERTRYLFSVSLNKVLNYSKMINQRGGHLRQWTPVRMRFPFWNGEMENNQNRERLSLRT